MATSTGDGVTMMAVWGSLKDRKPDAQGGFEGPEKRLEVIIRNTEFTDPKGFRSVDHSVWERVVGVLNAQIVSTLSNEEFDSFVLTESSLFVTANRVILITCGTTTLLNSLPEILDVVSMIRAEVEWMSFMRKNFSFPWEQKPPHHNMSEENAVLKKYFPTGRPYIFGPVDSDHYFFFSFDDIKRPTIEGDTQMSMTMYDMDPEVAKNFYSEEFHPTGEITEKIRAETGLCRILDDGWKVQDLQFAPCGYSVNAIRGYEYSTMHITPEDHCSFASYETNSRVANLAERMECVLGVFKPKRFTTIILIDPQSPIGIAYAKGEEIGVEASAHPNYKIANRTVNEFTPGYVIIKVNYLLRSAE